MNDAAKPIRTVDFIKALEKLCRVPTILKLPKLGARTTCMIVYNS